jgi:hypothetical protein
MGIGSSVIKDIIAGEMAKVAEKNRREEVAVKNRGDAILRKVGLKEEEEAGQTGAPSATSQATPQPVKINPSDPGGGLGAQVVQGLLGQQGPGTTSSTTTGPSDNPRFLEQTTETETRKQIGSASIPLISALVRGLGGPENFGTTGSTSTDTTRVPNPKWQQGIDDTKDNVGEAIFRMGNRDMRPDTFMGFLQPALSQYNEVEKKEIMAGAQQTAQLRTSAEVAQSRAAANNLMIPLLQNYSSLGTAEGSRVIQAVAFARTPKEVGEAHTAFGQLIFNSDESKGQRSRQQQEDDITRMRGEAAQISLDKAKVEAAVMENKMKTVGVMTANGFLGDRTQQEVSQSIKSTPGRDKDGKLKYTEETAGTVVQDQLDAYRLAMQVPLYEAGGFINGPSVTNFDGRTMEKYTHALQNYGFDRQGNLTNDSQKVDIKKTESIRLQALDYYAGLGIEFDSNNEPFIRPDNPNAPFLSRVLEVQVYKETLETGQKAAIPTIYDFQSAFKDPAQLPPVQGAAAPPSAVREPLATKAATSGRAFREFNMEVSRRLRAAPPVGRQQAISESKAQLGGAIRSFNEFFEEANRQP